MEAREDQVRERSSFLSTFIMQTRDRFTKTGSGYTQSSESTQKQTVFFFKKGAAAARQGGRQENARFFGDAISC